MVVIFVQFCLFFQLDKDILVSANLETAKRFVRLNVQELPIQVFIIISIVFAAYTPFPNLPRNVACRKSLGTACFHVGYRACSSAANLNALVFKVEFQLSNSYRKSVRQYQIISL